MTKITFRLSIVALISTVIATQAFCDDWPQFLGANRDGISNEKQLIETWPADGFKVAWKQDVGEGMSSCAIAEDKLVTLGQDKKSQYVVCLNVADGKELWRTALSTRYENGQGHGPRATPTIVGDSVFAFTGDGFIARLNLESGKVVWKVDSCSKFDGEIAEYGLASSPLVTEGKVIVQIDSRNKTSKLVCLSTDSGEVSWVSVEAIAGKAFSPAGPSEDPVGYCSPTLIQFEDKPHLITVSGSYIKLIELSSGRLIAVEAFPTDYACNTATPVVIDNNHVFISAGENHGCGLYQILRGDKGVEFKSAWESLGPKSVMRNEWQTSIRNGDYLFGFDNQGSAGPITNLACINWKTGEQAWKVPRFGKGNMTFAHGMLWISNMDGELIMGKLDAEKFVELGKQQVTDTTRQAPAISNGFLYFRGNSSVVCVDARKSSYGK